METNDIVKVILTALLSVATLFILAKIMGHKQMSQMDFFDYIIGITIGSIAAELATELETPLKPLVAMVVYGAVSVVLSILTRKLPKTRRFINGAPVVILNNDKIYKKNMKKAKLELSDFLMLCRQEGYFNLSDIQSAVFEYNGRLTILPKSQNRPVTPEDMNLCPKADKLCTEVVMDGKVLNENLLSIGLDSNWLKKQLKSQGCKSPKEVLLAFCDGDKQLMLYKQE